MATSPLRPLTHTSLKLLTSTIRTTTTTLLRLPHRKHLTTTLSRARTPFSDFTGPSPPRLPKEEQDLFEALQRQSTGAFSTPRPTPRINQSPHASASESRAAQLETDVRAEKLGEPAAKKAFEAEVGRVASQKSGSGSETGEGEETLKERFEKVAFEASGKGEELHPNVRRGAKPEFEGEVNPKTGEVGGPKNEPLRWGAAGSGLIMGGRQIFEMNCDTGRSKQ